MEVVLSQMPGEHQAKAESTGSTEREGFHLGVILAPADRYDPDAKGVTITAVDPDGAAAQQGLESGDVILNVKGNREFGEGGGKPAIAIERARNAQPRKGADPSRQRAARVRHCATLTMRSRRIRNTGCS
jgi:C-terminal processing protease CtpA/Prc